MQTSVQAIGPATWPRFALVATLLAPRLAVAIDAYRLGVGVFVASRLGERLRSVLSTAGDGLPVSGASATQLTLGLGTGLLACGLLVSGIAPRVCTLILLWVVAWSNYHLGHAPRALDDVLPECLVWLLILPVGHTLSLARRDLRGRWGALVSGPAVGIFLAAQSIFYARAAFSLGTPAGLIGKPWVAATLAAIALGSLLTRMRIMPVLAHIAIHVVFLRDLGAIAFVTCMSAMVYASPRAAAQHAGPLMAREAAGILYLLCQLAVMLPRHGPTGFAAARCSAVLSDLGLLPSRSITSSRAAVRYARDRKGARIYPLPSERAAFERSPPAQAP